MPLGSILGPLLLLIYINDLPKVQIHNAFPILFADYISITVTGSNIVDFQLRIKVVLEQLNNWFSVNLLSLNIEKTGFVHFRTMNARVFDRTLQYENKCTATLSDTKFLGVYLHNKLDWRVHIDQLIPKLTSALYAIRTLKQIMSEKNLIMI
jgi:hypothetical protein